MGIPASSRIVEVLHYVASDEDPYWDLGSGYLIGGPWVLTASHVVADGPIEVRRVDEVGEPKATWRAELELRGDPEIADIALLRLVDGPPDIPMVRMARVDRRTEVAQVLKDCSAIGFAQYKDRPVGTTTIRRGIAHVYGDVPNLDSYDEGLLTLNVTRPPTIVTAQLNAGISPFKGLSGAALTVGDQLIGVVTAHPPTAAGALSATPLTRLAELPDDEVARWSKALRVDAADLADVSPVAATPQAAVIPLSSRAARIDRSDIPVTILVLPNLGLFASSALHTAEGVPDLVGSLLEDLNRLDETYDLKPDLIMAPCGLVRTPVHTAYVEARQALDRLAAALELDPGRVLVAPAPRDVNPRLFQDSREDSRVLGRAKAADTRWDHLFDMLESLNASVAAAPPTREKPWEWREYPAERIAVAVLNSTMSDTGRGEARHGRLGPAQLAELAGLAATRSAQGWLCLGLIHDSPFAGDDFALADAAAFITDLGVHLNVVVHGRPCSYLDRVNRIGTLTAVGAASHPTAWYQILEFSTCLTVWGLVLDPSRNGWIGDTDVGAQPRAWSRALR